MYFSFYGIDKSIVRHFLPTVCTNNRLCTISLALNSSVGEASRAKTKLFILLRLNMAAECLDMRRSGYEMIDSQGGA